MIDGLTLFIQVNVELATRGTEPADGRGRRCRFEPRRHFTQAEITRLLDQFPRQRAVIFFEGEWVHVGSGLGRARAKVPRHLGRTHRSKENHAFKQLGT